MTKIKVITKNILSVIEFHFFTNIIYNSDKKAVTVILLLVTKNNIYHKRFFTNIYIFYFHILKLSLMHVLVK